MPGKGISPEELYETLFRRLGPQGWWPIPSRAGETGFDERGYHPGVPAPDLADRDRWEISAGAILTQNASWANAEKALLNLLSANVTDPRDVLDLDPDALRSLIRPSGYYNLKSARLRSLAAFMLDGNPSVPTRDDLLSVNGIGPETADSILLYAWSKECFVVDAYTIRVLTRIGLLSAGELPTLPKKRYEHVQNFILDRLVRGLPPGTFTRAQWYAEYHALFVSLCARHCVSRPRCAGCPLEFSCEKRV